MSKLILALSAGAALIVTGPVLAQTTQQTTVVTKKPGAGAGMGVLGGAATGALVAGPVGAVVGAVVGGAVGAAADPPAEVRTYVTSQNVAPVTYDGQIAVGQVLPETVTVYDVPRYERYRWTYVNDQRVLIDRKTRKIVTVLDGPSTAGPAYAAAPVADYAPTSTVQQSTTVSKKAGAGAGMGVLGGAAAGAVVGGPVGAVVGAVIGGTVGHAVEPPTEVRTYITSQNVAPVTYDGQIAVGQVLPETVTAYDVPRYQRYRWSYVNGQRVLIDRSTRKIVTVLDGDAVAGPAYAAAPVPGYAPTSTVQQTTTVSKKTGAGVGMGVLGGAAAGAVVGGPVGAVVGAVVGGTVGRAVEPPTEVRTYVTSQNVAPVTYDGQVAVGQVLPQTVTAYDIPRYERYRWSFVNGQRVLIDRQTRKIVTILDTQ